MEIYKKKTSREHILERPNMYIGASNLIKSSEYVLEDSKMTLKEVEVIPGLLKIINEIIDNSVDIAIKTDFKECNKITVTMTPTSIKVEDNGPGIPVKKTPGGEYFPFVCWGYAMSGSNFDNDENRTHLGMNGVGSYCTNVWSTMFKAISDDGENRYEVTFKDNASSFTEKVKKSLKRGVTVEFEPDLKRFGIPNITPNHFSLIEQRLTNLSVCFPLIQFKFNGARIAVNNFKKYTATFGEGEILERPNLGIAVLPSPVDDFQHFSYVNGLFIKDGGTHIDEMTSFIVNEIKKVLVKKYKTIRPSDIKSKIMVVSIIRGFPNPKFNSQSKEKLTNTPGEVNAFLKTQEWGNFIKAILKNKSIIDPIIEVFQLKEELKRRKELGSLSKPKKIKNDKYIPANKENKYLMITEGESACGSLMPTFGLDNCGYYMLKGKPLNAWDSTQQKFTANKELADLYSIIKNTEHLEDMEDGEWFEITLKGKKMLVNENDEVLVDGKWVDALKLRKTK